MILIKKFFDRINKLKEPVKKNIVSNVTNSVITINNKSYVGKSVSIVNGKVYINGSSVEVDGKEINIQVNGNIDYLSVDACSKITVNDVNSLQTSSGDIEVRGNVNGDINTTSGDVECGNVKGYIKTTSGDVSCGTVGGNISTISGDVKNRK